MFDIGSTPWNEVETRNFEGRRRSTNALKNRVLVETHGLRDRGTPTGNHKRAILLHCDWFRKHAVVLSKYTLKFTLRRVKGFRNRKILRNPRPSRRGWEERSDGTKRHTLLRVRTDFFEVARRAVAAVGCRLKHTIRDLLPDVDDFLVEVDDLLIRPQKRHLRVAL